MRVVPVLDLRDGQVVRAAGGDRRRYGPLRSPLINSAEPGDVAEALVKRFQFSDLYIADLTAIAGGQPDWRALEAIAATHDFSLHVDAGANTALRLERLLEFAAERALKLFPIVALETLGDPEELPRLAQACAGRGALSLDLRDGRPVTVSRAWREVSPREIAEAAIAAGFARLIVIDVARVGNGEGVAALPLCTALRRAHPQLSLWAGGGVRGGADLVEMAAAGCDGALVASALHDGRLSPEEVGRYYAEGRSRIE